jgi:signal peptidase II
MLTDGQMDPKRLESRGEVAYASLVADETDPPSPSVEPAGPSLEAPPPVAPAPDLALPGEVRGGEPSGTAPEPRERRQPASYVFFTVVAVVSAALDLGTKAWASKTLTGFDMQTYALKKVIVIKDHLDFSYAQNPGGAWSMLRSLPEVGRRPFFLMVSTVASVFIASVYARIDRRQWAMKWGLPLALGGAIGNLVDRIRNGWVVDFIHFWFKKKVGEYHWPTFNVADIWIVVGVALMAIDIVTSRKIRARLDLDGDLDDATPSGAHDAARTDAGAA